MNYENMWDELKAKLVDQGNTNGIFAMSQIEISYAERVCNEQPDAETSNQNCAASAKKEEAQKAFNDEKSAVLKSIFGDKFVGDLDSLKEAIGTMSNTRIVCDGRLDIPEELRALAEEKKILIAEADMDIIPIPVPLSAVIKDILRR